MGSIVSFAIAKPSSAVFDILAMDLAQHLIDAGQHPSNPRTEVIGGATVTVMPYVHSSYDIIYRLKDGILNQLDAYRNHDDLKRVRRHLKGEPDFPSSIEESVVVGAYYTDRLDEIEKYSREWIGSIGSAVNNWMKNKTPSYNFSQTTVQRPVPTNSDELYISTGNTQIWLTRETISQLSETSPEFAKEVKSKIKYERRFVGR